MFHLPISRTSFHAGGDYKNICSSSMKCLSPYENDPKIATS